MKVITHHRQGLALLSEIAASSEPFSAEGLKYLGRSLDMPPDLLRLLSTRPEAAKPIVMRIAEAMSRDGAAEALISLGQFDEAEAELSRLTELSPQLDGLFGAEAAIHLGSLRRQQWRLDEAREIFRKALAIRHLPRTAEMDALDSLIEIELLSGRYEEALALSDRALSLVRRRGDPAREAAELVLRSIIQKRSDRLDAAEKTLGEALELSRKASAVFLQASIEENLGTLDQRAERHERAAAHFEAAVRLYEAADLPFEEARTWIQLWQIYFRFDSRASASVALERAREAARSSESRLLNAWVEALTSLQTLRVDQDDISEVEEKLLAAMSLPEMRGIAQEEENQWFDRYVRGSLRSSGGNRGHSQESGC